MSELKSFDKATELQFIFDFIEEEDLVFQICRVQLRSLWTAFCLHQDLECGTFEYDMTLEEVWSKMQDQDNLPCIWEDDEDEGVIGFDLFEDFMCEEIV